MDNVLMQKDIYETRRLYDKILNGKKIFLELLDNILDIATLIPVCIAEYGNDFEWFNVDELIINDINSVLNEYRVYITHL